jgi:hypothetical protein
MTLNEAQSPKINYVHSERRETFKRSGSGLSASILNWKD